MPRDLFPPKASQEPMLTASPEIKTPDRSETAGDHDRDERDSSHEYSVFGEGGADRDLQISNLLRRSSSDMSRLHCYVSTLSISDLESCVALENAAFPEDERCSREKFIYRLTASPELCLGLFSSTSTSPNPETQNSHDAARAPDSSTPSHKAVLLAHVIATLTTDSVMTWASMDFAPTFKSHENKKAHSEEEAPPVPAKDPPPLPPKAGTPAVHPPISVPGHRPEGRTLAIHSVCVLPTYQHLGLGKTLLRSWLQRFESSGMADRAALLSHSELVGWYVSCFGFKDNGDSEVVFGSGKWRSLTYDFNDASLWSNA